MPARILLIEDNAANLELMSYLLRAFGHTVIAARDGHDGLASAHAERPDLILCDIQLPGIGGIEVASRIRGDAALDGIPLLAVTALAMVGDRETILAAGFDGYLTKPITPETFVQQVDAFLPADLRGTSIGSHSVGVPASSSPVGAFSILVVDDRDTNLELAIGLFGRSGFRVMTATGIRSALVLAAETRPDLIISDVVMSDGTGYEFLKIAKADPRLRAVPFILITSTMVGEHERQKGLALGAAEYIFRPIDPPDLLAAVKACLPAGR
jgi:two-component system cell cycle response regulator